MKKRTKNRGFTLAEVVITIAVVGVVAAITMPVVLKNIEKARILNKLKKSYAEISQVIRAVSDDNDLYSVGNNWEDTSQVVELLKPHLKISKIYPARSYYNPMCYNSGDKKLYSGLQYAWWGRKQVITTPLSNKGTVSVELLNGTCIGFAQSFSHLIYVDINGGKNGPNRAGKDLFFFMLTSNNKLKPYGYQKSYVSISTTGSGGYSCRDKGADIATGAYCAYRIMLDDWKIKYF